MDVFNLAAKLTLDSGDYDSKLDSAENKFSMFGEIIKGNLATEAIVKGLDLVVSAAEKAAEGLYNLVKDSVMSYADYEQLVGGVEKLFGTGGQTLEEYAKTAHASVVDLKQSGIDWSKYVEKAWMQTGGGINGLFEDIQYNIENLKTPVDELANYLHFDFDLSTEDAMAAIEAYKNAVSDEGIYASYQRLQEAQDLVMENAKNAYRTSGMSMNEYMETATSFSASLINSLGGDTVEAAELVDVAMQNISDNFNTFGGNIGMIQGAFQGFAKQNYTMLDNLKLGYGGTKTEMERLIDDANEYAATIGESSNLTIESFADVVKAIDLIQRKQKIRGTTEREAEKTIQGSIGMTKAAYKDLLTAIGGGGDVDQAFDNFINSFQTAVDNVIPVVERIIPAIGKIIEKITPLVEEYLPVIIEEISPLVMDAITIIGGALLDLLGELLPKLGEFLMEKLVELGAWLAENDPFINSVVLMIDGITELFTEFYNWIVETFTSVGEKISGFFTMAWERVKLVWNVAVSFFQNIWDSIKLIFSVVADVFKGDFQGAWDGIKKIIDKWSGYFSGIWDDIQDVFSAVDQWFGNKFGDAWDSIKQIINLWADYFSNIWESIKLIFSVVQDVLSGDFQGAWDKIQEIVDLWEGYFSDIWEAIKDIFEGIADWFGEKFEAVWDAIKKPFEAVGDFFGDIRDKITGFFQFDNADSWGRTLGDDFGSGVTNSGLENSLSGIPGIIASAFSSSNAYVWGSDLMANFVNGIYASWSWLTDAVSAIANTIANWIGFSEPKEGPLSKFHTFAPDMMELFTKGIKDNESMIRDQVAKSFDFEDLINREYGIETNITGNGKPGLNGYGAEPVSMTFNVYATERQDAEEVAREVQRVFLQWEGQRKAAYA